ncbi:type II toxin-antitoxin system RelE/ParE family toxin [Pseudomonas sp. R2.Fl]|nr:type II toxin-antitoxin system RelE/ParE family toxin [Pseudomonas sp. R2.Fl]
MNFTVKWSEKARVDVRRLYAYLLDFDEAVAARAYEAIVDAVAFLERFPFSCRKAHEDDPFLRELLIPFGSSGYIVLFRVDDGGTVTIAAVRHQREDDYH